MANITNLVYIKKNKKFGLLVKNYLYLQKQKLILMKVRKQRKKACKIIEIGEVGGHAHKLVEIAIPNKSALKELETSKDDNFRLFTVKSYAVVHDEHRTIFVPEGTTIAVQKEYNIVTKKLMNVLD